jgi:hypothetical protein
LSWWRLVISALTRLKQEDYKFEASLDYIVKPCLRKEVSKMEETKVIKS